jgi:protein O-GlcNAc transferase
MSKNGDYEKLQAAYRMHKAGQINEAARIYRQLVRNDPTNGDALHFLGVIEAAAGNLVQARTLMARSLLAQPQNLLFIENYAMILFKTEEYKLAFETSQQGLRINSDSVQLLYAGAVSLFKLNRLEESIAEFDKVLLRQPNNVAALNERASVLAGAKKYEAALASVERALSYYPQYAEAHLNKGHVCALQGRHDDALASYDRALALNANLVDAWVGRGNVFRESKRYVDALAAYKRALELSPDLIEAWLGRGNVLCETKRYVEALAAYGKVLTLKPSLAEAWLGRANALCESMHCDDALAAYDKALAHNPNLAEAWLGRANALYKSKHCDDALAAYDKALAHNPNLAEAWLGRGAALCELNLVENATADFARALAIKPDCAEARFASCFAALPILYTDEGEIVQRRTAYEQELRALLNDVDSGSVQGDLPNAIGFKLPFFLTYQGFNDISLQTLYGSLVTRVMERQYPPVSLPLPPTPNELVRVGIVSNFFYGHSNWKVPIRGWISQLDRNRFKIFGYHTGTVRDAETDVAAAMCDRFVHGALTPSGWREEILADAPHVLIYPGLLMDSMSIGLAAQRLAPVQCNSWGHPETSGIPTLDYYLSSDLMEPPDAEQHYSERLIRLPNLSVYYEPVDVQTASMSRAELGLLSNAAVFWCGQRLFKYLPQFDQVFPQIVEQAPHCQFIFLRHETAPVSDLFWKRLDRAFASSGLSASDYCVLLPRLNHSQFFAAMGQCDVFLDSIGWSGCNSTLESLPHNLPIVTLPGSLMRGRHSSAILQMMGITDTIADSVQDYVAIAARLANRPDERKALSRKISETKHRVYRDRACISALEEFLDRAARHPCQARA